AVECHVAGLPCRSVVMDRVVFPGTGYLEVLLALQDAVLGQTGHEIRRRADRGAAVLGRRTGSGANPLPSGDRGRREPQRRDH
ncbi:hypothetical protein, partial [Salinispora arenicola]|uniref:hypothetical protein n=1 Tax=Salinispora arenicola TaxID=168697 RepID=UPI0027DC9714